jgi:hypothetical protein
MSLLTQWGYTITDADAMAAMLSDADFNVITANKYAGDTRITPELASACMAVRNYVGWHLYPAQACSFSERVLRGNGRIKRSGADILVQLPAAYVSSVKSVKIDGDAWTDFSWEPNGLLRLFDVYSYRIDRRTEITVTYTAGIQDGMMGSIKELIASRATRALSGTNGVASESAGGVSVSYSSGWSNGGGAGTLQSTDVETLEPYKLREVF